MLNNMPPAQSHDNHTTSSAEYDLVGRSDSNGDTRIFDNVLYSDTGPVTVQETRAYYHTVSCLQMTLTQFTLCHMSMMIILLLSMIFF